MLLVSSYKKVLTGFLFFISLFIISISCDSTEPPTNISLTLKLEDVSCTEAWLQLNTTNLQLPNNVTLFINDLQSRTFNLTTEDTLLYIDSLLPNQNYSFQIVSFYNPEDGIKSNKVNATTIDTTSHNFSWQTFTFGQHSSSTLYDVTIIDENNIWAVGEIYMNDSLGNPDPEPYGIANWDGTDWKLKKVKFNCRLYFPNCGPDTMLITPVYSIFARDANDIWIVAGTIHHFNGNNWIQEAGILGAGDAHKIWGNDREIWFVGANGFIAQRSSVGSWKKIESGVDTDLKDIAGTTDGKEIWTCGWSNSTGRVSLLKINNSNVESLWDSQTNTTLNIYRGTLLNSLFANGNSEFVLVGGQVLRHTTFYKNQVKLEWVKTFNGSKVLELGNYAYRIKGSNKNNIITAGDAAMIWHFNGATWYKHSELYNLDDRLYGLAVTENVIVAVGKRYSPGTLGGVLLIIGRR
jgi:hypothetical protein